MNAAGIIRLTVNHLDELVALEKKTFSPIDQQTPRSFRYLLTRANAQVWGISDITGLHAVAIVLFRRGSHIARLYSIATDTSVQKKGLAARLLKHCETMARKSGCNYIRSEVRKDNHASQRLFHSAGYSIIKLRSGYYPDGVDAFRYEKPLT